VPLQPGSCNSRTATLRAEKAVSPSREEMALLLRHTWVSAMRENSRRVMTGEEKPSGVGAQLSITVSLWYTVERESAAVKGAGAR